jgi:hypothetical protein
MNVRTPLFVLLVVSTSSLAAQRPASPKPDPAHALVRESPLMQCPSVLGNGIKTQRLFCDILTGTDPAEGLRVSIPSHLGPATLLFTLHNRQAAADEGSKGSRAYARYTATLRVVTSAGAVLRQPVVQSEFRGPTDLVERIAGGAGRGGVKAVAPTGSEPITLELAPGITEVSLLGEKLTIERLDGTEVITAPGRPIAVVSQVQIEYRPPAASGTRRRS